MGQIYGDGNAIQTATKTFNNNDVVGLFLDMDKYELIYFINKEKVLTYKNLSWKAKKII
jgi:hypothetical protein